MAMTFDELTDAGVSNVTIAHAARCASDQLEAAKILIGHHDLPENPTMVVAVAHVIATNMDP